MESRKHVFISYKREDRRYVNELEKRIQKAGLATWTDKEISAGENWETAIDAAIQDAFALVLVMTPKARASEYVTYEWSYAMGLGVTIIPVLFESTDVHPKLHKIQNFDFTGRKSWTELLERLKELEEGYTPLNTRGGNSGYITEAHKKADMRALKELWTLINSSTIRHIIESYEYRILDFETRKMLWQYLWFRSNKPEMRFINRKLEQILYEFDTKLREYDSKMSTYSDVVDISGKEMIVPHYKISHNMSYEVIRIKESEYEELIDIGYEVLKLHEGWISAIREILPEFTFSEPSEE